MLGFPEVEQMWDDYVFNSELTPFYSPDFNEVEHQHQIKPVVQMLDLWKESMMELATGSPVHQKQAAAIRDNAVIPLEALVRHLDPYRELSGLWIKDVDGNKVPFEPYFYQKELWDHIQQKQREGKPCLILILKARKMGFSTLIEAEFYRRMKRNPGISGMVLAHYEGASAILFDMYKNFFKNDLYNQVLNYDEWGNPYLMERVGKIKDVKGSRCLEYKDPAGGKVNVMTAKSPDSVRSYTVQFIHASEVAYYDYAQTLVPALTHCYGKGAGIVVVYETTANGKDNIFYDLWTSDDDEYDRFFFPWWKDPRYKTPFSSDKSKIDFERSMISYERKMRERHNLSLEQLHFWHGKYVENGRNLSLTLQEMPDTPESAFVSTGRSVFPVEQIEPHENSLIEPKRYMIDNTGSIFPHADGPLWVFEEPKEGYSYLIGADVAEGIVVGQNNTTDRSAVVVLRPKDKSPEDDNGPIVRGRTIDKLAKQEPSLDKSSLGPISEYVVAVTFAERPTPDNFAIVLEAIGNRYNQANILVERNGPGGETIRNLRKIYPNIAKDLELDKPKKTINVLSAPSKKRYGFSTTEPSRKILYQQLIKMVSERGIMVPCRRLFSELSHLKYDNNGKPLAAYGHHDDLVTAFGLAIILGEFYPRIMPKAPRPKKAKRIRVIDNVGY